VEHLHVKFDVAVSNRVYPLIYNYPRQRQLAASVFETSCGKTGRQTNAGEQSRDSLRSG